MVTNKEEKEIKGREGKGKGLKRERRKEIGSIKK